MSTSFPPPPPSLAFLISQGNFVGYRTALRREDQDVLDGLFEDASSHLTAEDLAERALPFELMLLGMLIEQRSEIQRLKAALKVAVSGAAPWR